MLYNVLLGFETILAIVIVVLILLHRGRGSEAGAVFTGGSSASVFGSRGSTPFLTKLIASLAFVFILNSLSLAYIANRDFGSGSVIEEINIEQPPVVDSLPVDAEDDLPVEEEVFVDEFIDDIPEQIIEQESNEDLSDIPMLDENDQSEETIPQDSPTDGVR
ncbi:MAG: preprotein translocase subunit SecG [Chromatiales bacterium]|nr:preprotein translocase subunit SecG [Chromatiales bacterium]